VKSVYEEYKGPRALLACLHNLPWRAKLTDHNTESIIQIIIQHTYKEADEEELLTFLVDLVFISVLSARDALKHRVGQDHADHLDRVNGNVAVREKLVGDRVATVVKNSFN
jgi:hypothetical protein